MIQKINSSNLLHHELIGLPVQVARTLNSTQQGTEGVVLDETLNTLILHTKAGRRMIPKEGTIFQFKIPDGSVVDVQGSRLLRRPEDRVKTAVGKAA